MADPDPQWDRARAILGEAGRLSAPVADPRFIAAWYLASALAGFGLAYAEGGIVTEAVDTWAVANQGTINVFLDAAEGYGTPFFPATLAGAVGYISSWIRNHNSPR